MKRFIPPVLRRPLGRAKDYATRLAMVLRMWRTMEGATPEDARILARSLRAAPRDLLRDLHIYRYPTLLADAVIRVKGGGTFPVRGGTDDLAHVLPGLQAHISDFVATHASPGSTVVDGGANIGTVTYLMSRAVGPQGKVIAVEMMPGTHERLMRTIGLNALGNVEVVQNALSDAPEQVITARVPKGLHGQASIARKEARAGYGEYDEISVETVTLDQVTAGIARIACLKLDLEGAEALALKGAPETLAKTRAVIMESWNPDEDPALEILRAAGFAISRAGLDVTGVRAE